MKRRWYVVYDCLRSIKRVNICDIEMLMMLADRKALYKILHVRLVKVGFIISFKKNVQYFSFS